MSKVSLASSSTSAPSRTSGASGGITVDDEHLELLAVVEMLKKAS